MSCNLGRQMPSLRGCSLFSGTPEPWHCPPSPTLENTDLLKAPGLQGLCKLSPCCLLLGLAEP